MRKPLVWIRLHFMFFLLVLVFIVPFVVKNLTRKEIKMKGL